MDRAPTPEFPEEQETEEQRKRKKRFLDRLRGLSGPREVEVDLTPPEDTKDDGGFEEFWSREEEPDQETAPEEGSPFERAQQLGRSVLEQSGAVAGFAESLSERVEELPAVSRRAIKPEADRLQAATGELREATEELDEELEELDQVTGESSEPQADRHEAPPIEPEAAPEKTEPKRDFSEAMSMARLVIATLIGGGLGVLVGEGRKRERAPAKEKPKTDATIEQQKAKIAAQEAELQQLKAKQPEAGEKPAKEFVKKASELTERQVELTQSTVEQVKAAAEQAAESEKTFKIPEAAKPGQERAVEVVEKTERVEQLREQPGERQDQRSEQPGHQPASAHSVFDNTPTSYQPPAAPQPKTKFGLSSPRAMTYGTLLAVAIAIALGILLFGPK